MLIHGCCAVKVGLRRCGSRGRMASINTEMRFEWYEIVKILEVVRVSEDCGVVKDL